MCSQPRVYTRGRIPAGGGHIDFATIWLPDGFTFQVMSSPRSALFWVRWAIALVLLIWYVVAPRRAWTHFLSAVDGASEEQLLNSIDMPRFRENLRIDLFTAVMNNPGDADEKTRAETNRGMLPNLVDAASSPAGIQQTVAGFGYTGPAVMNTPNAPDISMHYTSPFSFEMRVHAKGRPESETGLFTFQLTTSGWRLTRIRSVWLAGKQA